MSTHLLEKNRREVAKKADSRCCLVDTETFAQCARHGRAIEVHHAVKRSKVRMDCPDCDGQGVHRTSVDDPSVQGEECLTCQGSGRCTVHHSANLFPLCHTHHELAEAKKLHGPLRCPETDRTLFRLWNGGDVVQEFYVVWEVEDEIDGRIQALVETIQLAILGQDQLAVIAGEALAEIEDLNAWDRTGLGIEPYNPDDARDRADRPLEQFAAFYRRDLSTVKTWIRVARLVGKLPEEERERARLCYRVLRELGERRVLGDMTAADRASVYQRVIDDRLPQSVVAESVKEEFAAPVEAGYAKYEVTLTIRDIQGGTAVLEVLAPDGAEVTAVSKAKDIFERRVGFGQVRYKRHDVRKT